MGRKNHRQRTFTQSRYAARAGICQQHEYKEHKIVTQDWKWAERTTGRGRSPRAGTLPAPASANSWNTKNIRLSHHRQKWAERTTGLGCSPRAGTLPPPASANSWNTKNIRLSHRTGNGQKEPRAEDAQSRYAAASANSTNTKNIRLSHRTGNGQKEPPAEDVHPEQVRCPRRHLPTARIQRT